jgi:4-amino-4-deoxy-L-arabinose transferase-like glycosyltransferase
VHLADADAGDIGNLAANHDYSCVERAALALPDTVLYDRFMGKSRWLWAVLVVGVAVRVWAYAASDNGIDHHHNAFDRPLFVEGWLDRGGWVPDPSYPPLHFYLLAALRLITADLEHAPRLLSLACGLLALWPLWLLTRRWFGDGAATWAALAYAVSPLCVRVSVVSLEVAPYLLLLLLAFERFSAAWAGPRPDRRAALTGSLWLTLAAATRFEAWLMLPVVALVALIRDRRAGWPAVAIMMIFPAVYLGYQAAATGQPWHFLTVSGVVSQQHMAPQSWFARLAAWPVITFFGAGPPVAVAALAGAVSAWRHRRGRWLLVVFTASLGVFIGRTLTGRLGFNETKYAAALVVMAAPFAGAALNDLHTAAGGAKRWLIGLLLLALIGVPAAAQIERDNRAFLADPNLRAVAGWLAGHRGERAVILGTRDQGYLLTYGRIPPAARRLAPNRDDTGRIDAPRLRELLRAPEAKLLVYDNLPDGLDFHPVLQLPLTGETERDGCRFSPVFSQGPYAVFGVVCGPF